MVISKAALNLHLICAVDKGVAQQSYTIIEPDGSVAVVSSKMIAWVSPLSQKKRELVPLEDTPVDRRIILTPDSVMKIIKAIPRDTQFKGLLEHCDISTPNPGTPAVYINITDGKQNHGIHALNISTTIGDYREAFREACGNLQHAGASASVCLNRKRLSLAMSVLDKVCPYDGQFAPIWWKFAADGSVLCRGVNELSDQRIWLLFSANEVEELPYSVEEYEIGNIYRKRKAKKMP